jgi:hypothetical protein
VWSIKYYHHSCTVILILIHFYKITSTYQIGCGSTSYQEGEWFSTLYTCNYGPNGNYINGQMYRQGTPSLARQYNPCIQTVLPQVVAALPAHRTVLAAQRPTQGCVLMVSSSSRVLGWSGCVSGNTSTVSQPQVFVPATTTTEVTTSTRSRISSIPALNESSNSLLFNCAFDQLSDDCLIQ